MATSRRFGVAQTPVEQPRERPLLRSFILFLFTLLFLGSFLLVRDGVTFLFFLGFLIAFLYSLWLLWGAGIKRVVRKLFGPKDLR